MKKGKKTNRRSTRTDKSSDSSKLAMTIVPLEQIQQVAPMLSNPELLVSSQARTRPVNEIINCRVTILKGWL